MKLLICVGIAVLFLAGCPGTTSQLSTFKKHEAEKNYVAIANTPIESNCAGSDKATAECAQLAEIKGRACLTLVQQQSAPNAACPPATDSARSQLQCAAANFDVARAGQNFPPDQLADMTEMRARALYCGATLEASSQGLVDVNAAANELGTLPPTPSRDQLAASTQLYVANNGVSNDDRCNAAKRSASLADRGMTENPTDDLKQGLMNTRAHAVMVAAHLQNCQVP
jgi:hypothetical protein